MRNGLLKDSKALAIKFEPSVDADACDIAPGPRQIRHKALRDRVATDPDNGNCGGRLLKGEEDAS